MSSLEKGLRLISHENAQIDDVYVEGENKSFMGHILVTVPSHPNLQIPKYNNNNNTKVN